MSNNNNFFRTVFIALLLIGFAAAAFIVIQLLIRNAVPSQPLPTPTDTTTTTTTTGTTQPQVSEPTQPRQPAVSYQFTDVPAGSEKVSEIGYFDSLQQFMTELCRPKSEDNKIEKCEVAQQDESVAIATLEMKYADDSVAGAQTIYRLSYANGKWSITGKQQKHRCQPGRGSADWSFELCV